METTLWLISVGSLTGSPYSLGKLIEWKQEKRSEIVDLALLPTR